jgi:hypothetical protein
MGKWFGFTVFYHGRKTVFDGEKRYGFTTTYAVFFPPPVWKILKGK